MLRCLGEPQNRRAKTSTEHHLLNVGRNAPKSFFFMRVLTGIVGIAIPVLLARAMPVGDFANYATIGAAAAVSTALSSLGVDRSCLRFLPTYAGKSGARRLWRFLGQLAAPRFAALVVVLTAVLYSELWLPAGETRGSNRYSAMATLLVGLSATNALSQLSAAAIQGLLLHGTYAVIALGTVLARLIALLLLAIEGNGLNFSTVLQVFIITEIFASGVQLAAIGLEAASLTCNDAAFRPPPISDVAAVCKANYASYLVGTPWMSPALILLVSNFTTREVTAAYAFFQTLAERAKTFLPMQLLQGYVEPTWALDYQENGRVRRLQASLQALLISNVLLISLAIALVGSVGEMIVQALTKAAYADHLYLVLLILIQQVVYSVGSALWIGMNATGQASHLAKGYAVVTLLFYPIAILLAYCAGAAAVIVATWLPFMFLFAHFRYISIPFVSLQFGLVQNLAIVFACAVAGLTGFAAIHHFGATVPVITSAVTVCVLTWLILIWHYVIRSKRVLFIVTRFAYGR